MKKYLVYLIVIAALLSAASCGFFPGGPQPSPSTEPSPSASAPTESPSASPTVPTSPSPDESAVVMFLAGEPTAGEVGLFIKENMQALTPDNADLLLERLLLLQLDISAVLNLKVWEEPYLTALNVTMGGILDAAKIGDIEDEQVRADYQKASDGMMTIVRYEETPVFETDWAALEAVKDAFSDGAAQLVTYQSRFQGRYYFGDPYAFDLMAEDVAAVEKLIISMDNGFVRWQLKSLYNRQVGRILYGAEGEWLFAFSDGDAQVTQRIKKFAETYPDTDFGMLCAGMLKIQTDGLEALSALIGDSLAFPPGDPRSLTKTKIDDNGAAVEYPQITGLKEADVLNRLNTAIAEFSKGLLKDGNNNQSVGYYMSFVNDKYISFNFSYSYRNESDTDHYSEAYLMLDLRTGEAVSLDDLAEKTFDTYKDDLMKAIIDTNKPVSLTEPVSFMLDRNEIILSVPSAASDWPDYYTITFNGLRSFMDVSKLY